MKSDWIKIIVTGLITVAGFWKPFVLAADVQHVQFGSTVTLGCNISYLYDTTWLKHSPDFIPTVVLCASLKEGRPVQVFQLSPHFSVRLKNRSLALRISGVKESDLGLYYCVAIVNTQLTVGSGTTVKVLSPGSFQFLPHNWYCVAVGGGLLIMVLAVCITHWKAKSCTKTTHESYNVGCTQKGKSHSIT